jgi:hypothetical protein
VRRATRCADFNRCSAPISAVAPGGRLIIVGHHTDNLAAGVGGPQDRSLLFTPEDAVVGEGSLISQHHAVVREINPLHRHLQRCGDCSRAMT